MLTDRWGVTCAARKPGKDALEVGHNRWSGSTDHFKYKAFRRPCGGRGRLANSVDIIPGADSRVPLACFTNMEEGAHVRIV
jgi:hypothetical protein